jgi:hypothetical protein
MTVSKKVYMLALHRAAQNLGGVEALRAYLGVPMSDLCSWIEGERPVPSALFFRVVDLLAEAEISAMKRGVRDQSDQSPAE